MGVLFLDPDILMMMVGVLTIISCGLIMMLAGLHVSAAQEVELKRALEFGVAWGAVLLFGGAYIELAPQVSRLESWALCLLSIAAVIWWGFAGSRPKIKKY